MSSKLQIDQGGNMGKILDYANNKKELDNLISDETRRLCLEGLSGTVFCRSLPVSG
jgi:hypothetical protein